MYRRNAKESAISNGAGPLLEDGRKVFTVGEKEMCWASAGWST